MAARGEHTRTALIAAARELFYHRGYHATSYGDLAGATGVAKGNIHYHFNAKEALLLAVIESRKHGIRDLLAGWTRECDAPQTRLMRFVDMLDANATDLAQYGCPMGTLNAELGKQQPDLLAEARGMFALFEDWLTEQFAALLPAAEARRAGEQLMVMAQGASLMGHSHGDAALVHREAEAMRQWLRRRCAGN